MTRLWTLLTAVAFTLMACRLTWGPKSTETQSERLVVLTYNIHHGEGMDGRIDLNRIGRVICDATPDLVALQEVDSLTTRSGGVDQAATLAAITGMYVIYGPAFDFDGGKYGNAILSKWKPDEVECTALPGEPRSLLKIRIRPPQSPEPIYFFATHLDTDSLPRRASVPLIAQALPAASTALCLLAGDMNAGPDSPTLEALRKDWTLPEGIAALATFPVDTPERQIDFVMVRPALRWTIVSATVLQEEVASDHRPLRMVLEIKK
jgi:endonuclease/exonuclease/phosphatase family metal-dependent hydrolase